MFASPSPLLFVSLSPLNPHSLRHELCLSFSLRGRGEKETPEMSNLNEATTYATTAGQTPYLVLFCGCRVRALLWGTQKFDWCNRFATMLPEQVQDSQEKPLQLIYRFYETWATRKDHKQFKRSVRGLETTPILFDTKVSERTENTD